ncbi:YceH family protein [Mariprofundus ferrooxydans]|uniref:YceH family protein n=1 Tax=Mariprofundus ferrooxydans TaxID=314344 RepID=UPI001431264A|nr:YceH family protein [Mariprofundus ferrooxydans]
MDEPVTGMLSALEARVLGCLMEKQMTTPDYYPLTLKALTAACNQKSSRVPVMNLSESETGGVVNGLRAEGLVTARMDGRADRFEHHLSRKLGLSTKERAVLCVLMLRGALTVNEIRINTGRMTTFDSVDELQTLLDGLIGRDDPLLIRIPRAAGQREDRYAHLLCGVPEFDTAAPASAGGSKASDRIDALEQEVADLKADLQRLWQLTGLPKA